MIRKKSSVAVGLILVCVAVVLATKAFFSPGSGVGHASKIGPRAQGNPDGDIKIVEFMDFQCRTCAEASPILKNYIFTYPNRIYWQVKYYPLVKSHLYALKGALYAECAARQNKFWPMSDAMLENQKEWSSAKNPDPIFERLAQEAQLDVKALRICLDGDDAKNAVQKDKDEAINSGVKATPTFFVNGSMVVGHKALQEDLDARLKK